MIEASAVARAVGVTTAFKDLRGNNIAYLPQRIAVIGQGNAASVYATTKAQYTSANAVGAAYGYGSPLHLAARQLFPANGDGVGTIPVTFYPLEDGTGTITGSIDAVGAATAAGTIYVMSGNVASSPIAVAVGDTGDEINTAIIAAVNAILHTPVIASQGTGVVTMTPKWICDNSLEIQLSVSGTIAGIAFTVVQMSGSPTNPTVDAALAQIGNVWETLVLNCLAASDSTALDAYDAFGEGRWGALVRKPLVVFTGDNQVAVADASTIPDARTTDRTNCILVAPGSADIPFVIAARQLSRIAVVANNNPAHDYAGQSVTVISPGTDAQQWLYADRDLAVKAGCSTVEVEDGVVKISDVVTCYHPTGEEPPAYRYVCDIVKLQNVLYNINLEFESSEWRGAPLIPDNQPTTNPTAKKPKMAKAAMFAIIDALALDAIISDPAAAKASVVCAISSTNPKRLDCSMTIQLSGNTNIISVDLNFGFYFGTAAIVA